MAVIYAAKTLQGRCKGVIVEKAIRKYLWIFVMPTFAAFAIAFLAPFVMGVVLSFSKFTTVTNISWVGFANYAKAFSNPEFLNALRFSAAFVVVSVFVINIPSFTLALLLSGSMRSHAMRSQGMPGTNLFRTMIFMPNLIGGIVLGYIWQFIINGVLGVFGVTVTVDPKYGFWGMVVLSSWQYIGYMMIIYIAGIQNIPAEVIEAATIDGASRWTILRKITIPLVMPSITITMFMSVTNSFKMFDQNLALTAGAPGKSTVMVALDIYKTFYDRPGFEGVAQAKALMFFIMVAIIALVQISITRKREVSA